ncbi:MAG: Quinone oxidoreductase 1 [Pseudomonadota bacterium]|jgi:NADPH2:quinone reductase
MKVCTLSEYGDVSKLKIEEQKEPAYVQPNEVIVRYNAISVNFDDTMYRRGIYKAGDDAFKEKFVLGFEGAGIVIKKGEAVQGFEVGDVVAHAFSPFGTYSHFRIIDYRYLIHVPEDINQEIVAGVLRKGLLVENMLFKTYNALIGQWILVHSVAGGVGHILAKWAKSVGLNVIGTVGDESKVATGLATGCNFVINRATESISKKVFEYTNGVGVNAVFDGIGQKVFEESLTAMQPLGLYISYGYASGLLDKISVLDLRARSAFFATPVLEIIKANRFEYIFSASSLFEVIRKGTIIPQLSRYSFDAIPQAHLDLESGKTTGSLIINNFN